MNKKILEEKFIEYRKYLVSEAIYMASYISLYKCLQERRNDRLDQMNIAPGFFQTVLRALFSVIIIWVDKFFDEKSERGIFDLLNFVEKNVSIFSISNLKERENYPNDHWMLNRKPITIELINEDRQRIRELKSLKSFKIRRNKYHAHFDKEYFFDRGKIDQDAPLNWNDFEEVIEITKDILSRYSSSFDGTVNAIVPINSTDINRILNILYDRDNQEYG